MYYQLNYEKQSVDGFEPGVADWKANTNPRGYKHDSYLFLSLLLLAIKVRQLQLKNLQ